MYTVSILWTFKGTSIFWDLLNYMAQLYPLAAMYNPGSLRLLWAVSPQRHLQLLVLTGTSLCISTAKLTQYPCNPGLKHCFVLSAVNNSWKLKVVNPLFCCRPLKPSSMTPLIPLLYRMLPSPGQNRFPPFFILSMLLKVWLIFFIQVSFQWGIHVVVF